MVQGKAVCFVHLSSYPGGAEVLIPEVIAGFPDLHFISFVIRPDLKDSHSIYKGRNNRLFYGSSNNLIAAWKLFKFALQNRKARFHVWGIGPFFLFVLRFAGIRNLVYSIHGTIYWKNTRQKLFRRISWFLAINRKDYLFTANSDYSKKIFKDKIDSHINITTIYNPVNLGKFNSVNRKIKEPGLISKIVYAGRLTSGKGLDKWLETAYAIHKETSEVRFEIYGEGSLRQALQKNILSHQAEDYIFLKGHTDDMAKVYREADLLLFLSEYESFGNVVVESILCGTPVITTDIPSMKEIFQNYPDFLIPSDGDLVDRVMSKLKDYSNLVYICSQAKPEFESRFSKEQHIEKLKVLYEKFNN